MKQISHALYPVLRYFGYFDQDLYAEETASEEEDFDSLYQGRQWESCEAEVSILAKYAGISRPSVYEALKDLENHNLIESKGLNYEGAHTWKVFLIPPKYYTRDYLNGKVMRRYKLGS